MTVAGETHDCGHSCCDEPDDPYHGHFLTADECPSCKKLSDSDGGSGA